MTERLSERSAALTESADVALVYIILIKHHRSLLICCVPTTTTGRPTKASEHVRSTAETLYLRKLMRNNLVALNHGSFLLI